MGSRFFTQGDSSSESSSDEEELYSDEEAAGEGEEESSEEEDGSDEDEDSSSEEEGGKVGVSKFLKDAADSDSDEESDGGRVVKSAKDKRLEEVEGVIKLIDNAVRINDWSVISTGTSSLPAKYFRR
jgi:translation initiation factor 3 subunit C